MLSVVVVVKMVATDFLATTMQNDVFLGYTANSHGNLLVSPESQTCQMPQKKILQKFLGIWQGWLANVTKLTNQNRVCVSMYF
jgi:hypothetical protein